MDYDIQQILDRRSIDLPDQFRIAILDLTALLVQELRNVRDELERVRNGMEDL